MNRALKCFIQSRYPLAIAAGLLLAAAFPKPAIAGLAWIAPGLMLAAAAGKRGGTSFRIGYVAGLAHYLASLYWLLLIPVTGFPILGWVALSAYLALWPATWVWLCGSVLCPRSKVESPTADTESPQLEDVGELPRVEGNPKAATGWTEVRAFAVSVLEAGWLWRVRWALLCAAMWTALEMILARFLSGFPWDLLGVSQWHLVPLIQIASVTGVVGVSFLVVWGSVTLFSAGVAVLLESTNRHAWMREILLPLVVVLGLSMWGAYRIGRAPATPRHVKLAMVQPSIPQTLIWDRRENTNRFRELLALSEQALTNRPDILLWPEAAVPNMVRYDAETYEGVTGLARSNHVWMIIGSDDAERRAGSSDPDAADYFNSSILVSPRGHLVDNYRKHNLVIFGEYVPFTRALPFLKYLTPIDGGFTPGTEATAFELPDVGVTTAVLICFEDTFPQLARLYVRTNTDFLVNLTNDGWFGEGAAQWQQMATALFRAVENGVPLVRCSNNGLTCWIDGNGIVRQIFSDEHGSVYGKGVMTMDLPLPDAPDRRPPTYYNLHGDVFGWSCVGVSAVVLASRLVRRRRAPRGGG